MFSPYYHWAGRKDPENHVCINVALYGRGARRWTMTERGRAALSRSADVFTVGPSALSWQGGTLVIDIDEISAPIPRRVKGQVRVHPEAINTRSFALDSGDVHHWMPLAPQARIEARFTHPGLAWQGHAYVDTNAGLSPMQSAFREWDWSRATLSRGTAVLYDTTEPDGLNRTIATLFRHDGSTEDFAAPPRVRLPTSLWGIRRVTQAEDATAVALTRTLEDTPFYARSELMTSLLGEVAPAVHESIIMTRLDTTLVRLMLPWKMPRRFW